MEISNFKLGEADFGKITRILRSLTEKTHVNAIFLVNRNGQEITHCGSADGLDVTALSSLAASNLAATFGLASLLGEKEFSRVYLRGDTYSILISPAGEHALLLFVVLVDREKELNLRDLRQAVLVLGDVLKKCNDRVVVSDLPGGEA